MKISLRIKPAEGETFDKTLQGDSILIGRSRQAELQVPDRYLSRQHARLFRRGSLWMLEDLGSQNGTWLNRKRLSRPELVQANDNIQLSDSTITVLQIGDQAFPTKMDSIFVEATRFLESEKIPAPDIPQESWQVVDRLRLLNEVHGALAETYTKQELVDMLLDKLFSVLHPEQASIFLRDEEGELFPAGRRSVPDLENQHFHSRHVMEEVGEKGMAALVHDINEDERFSAAQSIISTGIRSLVAAPMMDGNKTLGLIVLNSRINVRKFTEEDMALLVSLASVGTLRIRNLSLAEEAAKRRRLEEELTLARRIQEALIPNKLPTIPGYALFASNLPSQGVSGDFYQVLTREKDYKLILLVADVSGKGMSASLLTASLEALAAGPIEDGHPPDEICARLSTMLLQRTPPERYATLVLAELDPGPGILRFTNAGHNQPVIIHQDGQVTNLEESHIPVGLFPILDYQTAETQLQPGDLLVLYTDGLTEAENPQGKEYGPQRLTEICSRHRDSDLSDLAQAVWADLEHFAEGVPFGDDRTLVLVKRQS